MQKRITRGAFIQEFENYNRADNFSLKGRNELYDYFTEMEAQLGMELNLDIIGICCQYAEYEATAISALANALDDLGYEHAEAARVSDAIIARWDDGIIIDTALI